jgi:hypothetical protein
LKELNEIGLYLKEVKPMRKKKTEKSSSNSQLDNLKIVGSKPTARSASDDSLRYPEQYTENEEYLMITSFDVQLTVRSKVKLTRRQVCILSGILLREVAETGLNLKAWIVFEFFYSYLLGNKQDLLERKDPIERELLLLIRLILTMGSWMTLSGRVKLPVDVQVFILSSAYVPNQRTISSWKQIYNLNKYLEIRAVPLDVLLERSQGTQRYSGYCKGYGESHPSGRRQKTKISSELDGEPVDLDEDQTHFVFDSKILKQLFTSVLLEIKYRDKNSAN